MNPNNNQSCPVVGCGKAGPGKLRNHILEMKCPVHGKVQYNYETQTLTKL